MSLKLKFKRLLSLLLVAAMVGGQTMPLQAAMVDNHTLMEQEKLAYDREQLLQALEREDVQKQLEALGVDPAVAKQRVAQMTDSEIQQINARMGEMPAGGDALGVILFIFLIFVITDILGATDIFPFIHPIR